MASEVHADGAVVAPLNITAPAPAINLKGFLWETVDEKIHGFQDLVLEETSKQQPLSSDALQSSQRAAAAQSPATGSLPNQLAKQIGLEDAPQPGPLFPLEQFQGAYAGNGFNMIFRPRADGPDGLPQRPGANAGPDDNILELNLTTEQMSFGGGLGQIPNRGLKSQPDIFLRGLPYLQTVQDVTNPDTGKGDHPKKTGVHFEPGVWLNVPPASFQKQASIVRMASVPHGTTINAQGFAPVRDPKTVTGGVAGPPVINDIDTTPFTMGNPSARLNGVFKSMDEKNERDFRLPQELTAFGTSGTGIITTAIIKNPNLVLVNANKGLKIAETITFEVCTGPPESQLNGGGTANIAFLAGQQVPITSAVTSPTAHAVSMTAKYWIERVMYKVVVPGKLPPRTKIELRPTMPPNSTAPTPVFSITTGPSGNPTMKEIMVPGTQIQSSQTVLLNFATLSWPHVSVATLVPTNPQPFQMT